MQAVYDQHTRDLARILQLAINRAEEKLKAKMDLDKAKMESPEAKLERMHIVARKFEEKLVSKK